MFRMLQNASKSHFRRWPLALLSLALGCASLLTWHRSQAASQTQSISAANAATSNTSRTTRTAAVAGARREDLQQCTINCGATVPTTGQTGQAVAFAASAPTQGCTTQPTYAWDFGDGTTSTQQNPSKTYTAAGTYNWRLTTSVGSGGTNIDTIVGGLGEGAGAKQSPYLTPYSVAADPQNRGVFVMENAANGTVLRFINTTNQAVTLGGRVIEAGTNRTLVGGGLDEAGENVAGGTVSLADAFGLGVHPNGNLVYFSVSTPSRVRALNISASNQTVGTRSVAPGNVATLAEVTGTDTLNGLAVNSTGDVFVASPATGVNRVYRINANGQVSNFAGNGAATANRDAFVPGPATSVPLLQPRALEIDPNGNVYIADASHQRVIRVDPAGAATLIAQFTVPTQGQGAYPAGLAFYSGSLYVALGNAQMIMRIAAGQSPVRIAGTENKSCDYSTNNCGDGGAALNAEFFVQGSSGTPPFTHIDADANGLLIPDQGSISRGRIRYLNLSSAAATLAGTTVPSLGINTIAGNGLLSPYDGVIANAAELRITNGLAVDANNNLWLADSSSGRLRFVNRSNASITLFPNTAAAQVVAPGTIVTVNKDVSGGTGDDTTANQMSLNTPQGLYATSQGLYIVETLGAGPVGTGTTARKTGRVRFLNTTSNSVTIFPQASTPIVVPAGNVKTIVGGGQDPANIGNGGFALNAKLLGPSDIVVTGSGDIYIADTGNKTVRKVLGTTGIVSGLTLTSSDYIGLALDSTGRLYIADNDGNRVLRENGVNNGNFSSITTETTIYRPRDIVVDSNNNVYVLNAASVVSDSNVNAHRIVRVTPSGATSVYAGTTQGFSGDGGPATAAQLNIYSSPVNLLTIGSSAAGQADTTINMAITSTGEILFSDIGNYRIRRIASGEVVCTRTGTITLSGSTDNPVPTVSALTPAVRGAGTGAFTLTVNGTNFVSASVVRWNGQNRATTFVNATTLTAQILAGDVATVGTVPVTVFNPTPGGGASNPVNFSVQATNPVPAISSIVPATIAVNTPFTLTVNGSNFTSSSVIRWEGQTRPTTFVNEGQLRTNIPASDVANAGSFDVSVFTPEPGGGASTNSRFVVISTNPVPTLTFPAPAAAAAGGQGFTLTVNGTNFMYNSVVRWNGQNRTTTYVSSTQLTIPVAAADIATAGTAQLTVFTGTPGGGVSSTYNFPIGAPAAGVSAASYAANLSPESIVALFGVNLATGIKIAETIPLPTTLEGTSITVRDSQGVERPAPLFFVAPAQVNFQLPPGTAAGPATVVLKAGDGKISVATPNVTPVQPAIFTANASGGGPASAVALRVRQDGTLSYEETLRFENGQLVAVPIDLGPATDQVFLIVFGTGFRANDAAVADSATLAGQSIAVLYAGAQGGLVGLDQFNLGPVSRSLIGRGSVNLSVTIDGITANTVTLSIK